MCGMRHRSESTARVLGLYQVIGSRSAERTQQAKNGCNSFDWTARAPTVLTSWRCPQSVTVEGRGGSEIDLIRKLMRNQIDLDDSWSRVSISSSSSSSSSSVTNPATHSPAIFPLASTASVHCFGKLTGASETVGELSFMSEMWPAVPDASALLSTPRRRITDYSL